MQLAMTKKTKIEYTVSNPNDLVKFWFNVIGSVIHFFRILSTIPVWCIFASLEKPPLIKILSHDNACQVLLVVK